MTLGEGNDAPPESPHRPTSVWSVVLRGIAILVAVTLTGGSVTAYLRYRHDWQAIKRINVSQDLVASRRPAAAHRALNILLIGSDTRSGVNGKIGGQQGISGARSDTVMVLHIVPAARRIVVLRADHSHPHQ